MCHVSNHKHKGILNEEVVELFLRQLDEVVGNSMI